ncbi:hypothetical protein [Candidatus Sororendozoicomonas aggregata]|uniref:hypothetical protein n=1 Tax=Candidatus Sororendozoicomonas aggregata TaxID=3073239 RepID=UPI002ED10FC5
MKKYALYFSLPALIMWATSNVYATSTCQGDFNEMCNFIKSHHTLSSKNGVSINQLFGPATSRGAESCGAKGEGPRVHHCINFYRLYWKRGNWRDTLIAKYPVFKKWR